MIIYEVTNKYTTMDELLFSKYYPTKELALDTISKDRNIEGFSKASNLEVYKLELNSLGREDLADILSMNHVRMEQVDGGWNEVHDISYLTKSEVKIK